MPESLGAGAARVIRALSVLVLVLLESARVFRAPSAGAGAGQAVRTRCVHV